MQSHLAVALDRVPPDSEGWESVWQGLIPPLAALAFQGRTIEAEPFERVVAAIGVLGRLRNAALASHWPGIVAKLRALPPLLRLRAYAICRLGPKPGSAAAWAEVWPLFADWLERSAMALLPALVESACLERMRLHTPQLLEAAMPTLLAAAVFRGDGSASTFKCERLDLRVALLTVLRSADASALAPLCEVIVEGACFSRDAEARAAAKRLLHHHFGHGRRPHKRGRGKMANLVVPECFQTRMIESIDTRLDAWMAASTTSRQRADTLSAFRSMAPMALGARAPRLVGLLLEDREFRHSVLQLVRRLHRRIGPQFMPAELLLAALVAVVGDEEENEPVRRSALSTMGQLAPTRGQSWARLCAPFIPLIAQMAHRGAAGGLSMSTGTTALWVLWRLLADESCLAMLHDHHLTMLKHWQHAWREHGVAQMPCGCPAQLAQHARSRHTSATR